MHVGPEVRSNAYVCSRHTDDGLYFQASTTDISRILVRRTGLIYR